MYVALAAILGALVGGGIAAFILTGPIPFRDQGFRIFAATDERARDTIVRILPHFGLKPSLRIDTAKVKRAMMSDNMTVISATGGEVWETMGSPAAGLALRVKDPLLAAVIAVDMLRAEGFEAEVLGELDPNVPRGAMVFVKTNAFVSTLLVFRKHFFKMGRKPPRWQTQLPERMAGFSARHPRHSYSDVF